MTVQLKAQLSLGGQLPCKKQGAPYVYFCFKNLVTLECIWFVVFSIGIEKTGKMTIIMHTLQRLGI